VTNFIRSIFRGKGRPSDPPQQQVVFVPDHFFFSQSLPVPSDLSLRDVVSFAEMSLEQISPFAVDQLNWGFLYKKGCNKLFIYAALEDRLASEGITTVAHAVHAFPPFVALTHRKFPSNTLSFLFHTNRLMALFFEEGSSVPSRIESVPCEDDSVEKVLAEREKLIASVEHEGFSTETGFWQIKSCQLNSSNNVVFSLSHTMDSAEPSTSHTHKLKGDDRFLWNADIRHNTFLEAEYKKRRVTYLIWKSVLAAGIFASFLLGGEGIKLTANILLKQKNQKIAAQEKSTSIIESNDAISNKIQSIISKEMRPFALIKTLNDARPKNIYFTSVLVDRSYSANIEGIADNANSFNNYMQALNTTKKFDKTNVIRILAKSGRTNFAFNCQFKSTAIPTKSQNEPQPQTSPQPTTNQVNTTKVK